MPALLAIERFAVDSNDVTVKCTRNFYSSNGIQMKIKYIACVKLCIQLNSSVKCDATLVLNYSEFLDLVE